LRQGYRLPADRRAVPDERLTTRDAGRLDPRWCDPLPHSARLGGRSLCARPPERCLVLMHAARGTFPHREGWVRLVETIGQTTKPEAVRCRLQSETPCAGQRPPVFAMAVPASKPRRARLYRRARVRRGHDYGEKLWRAPSSNLRMTAVSGLTDCDRRWRRTLSRQRSAS